MSVVDRKLYLSPADFLPENAPDEPEEYHFPTLPTRDSFGSFLEDGFAKSRGKGLGHRRYLFIVRAVSGFQWRKSLTAFLATGGWNTLSSVEQDHFRDKFHRVEDHLKRAMLHDMWFRQDGQIWQEGFDEAIKDIMRVRIRKFETVGLSTSQLIKLING